MKKISFFLLGLVCTFLFLESRAQVSPPSGVRVTQAPITVVKLVYAKHNLCSGDKKGAINIDVSGGVPPYSYRWSNGSTTQDITGLQAGTYKVMVADANKCKDSLTVEITEQPRLVLTEDSVSDILCYGYKKGAVHISVKGGTAPYKYSWSNGATTEDISNINAGSYSVLVSDANNCQEILSSEVKQNPLIVRSIDDVKNIKCNGDSTGKVDITVSGGIPPYSYIWNNGSTSEDLANLKAGKYTVIVTDANGCKEASNTTVSEPSKMSVLVEEVKHIKCNGSNSGAISISVNGGVAPYKYKWSNGAVSQDINGVVAGFYKVLVTDANGCSMEASATINEPELLIAAVSQQVNVSYFGGSNGSIQVKVSGGVAPYKYTWSNGATTKDISGLKAGSYSLLVTDANGCSKNIYVMITEPKLLVLALEQVKNIKCNGDKVGAIQVAVTGGVTPYTYKWNNGATTEDITELPAGNYTLEVTDANGIKKSISATITQPEYFDAKLLSVTNIDCYGEYKGGVSIGVSGGVLPYKFKWSNGANTQNITAVPFGNYSVEIHDANSCVRTISTTVNQSPEIIANIGEIKNVLCYADKTGAINVSVSGGVAPYTYVWSNGTMSPNLSNVASGEYSVTIKDAKSCTKMLKAKVTQPNLLTVAKETQKEVSCFGKSNGSVNLTVEGGVAPYKYAWSNGTSNKSLNNVPSGAYSVKVSDVNGCTASLSTTIAQPTKLISSLDGVNNVLCNGDAKGAVNISVTGGVAPYSYKWNNGSATQDLIDVKAGSYSVLIADANGCKDTIKATITQNTSLLAKVLNEKDIKCNGDKKGAIDISVSGGVAPYTYKWSNGSITQNILDVQAGMYTAIITDAVGCVKSITSKISEPPLFTARMDAKSDVKCFGDSTGSISISVKGGVAPYAYKWSNGSSEQDITSLRAGEYSVKINDANGCLQNITARITQPTTLLANVESVSNLKCAGDNSGVVNISVKGGTSPYSFSWSDGSAAEDLTNALAGNYQVKINDANGCSRSLKATITEPVKMEVELLSKKDINCFGEKKGAASISVTGGVAPYTYSWSNGSTTKDILDVPAGNYTVIVKDSKGCLASLSVSIAQPSLLSAKVDEVKNVLCAGDTTGSVNVSVKGGSAPYSYKWSNLFTSEDLTQVKSGNYSMTVTDAKGCTQSLSATITSPPALVPYFESVRNVLCSGEKSGIVNISINGGVAPYQYKWNNGATTQDLTNIGAGDYSVSIRDANGCVGKSITASIKEPSELVAEVAEVKNVQHYGESNGAVSLKVSGGVAPYKFSWSNSAITQNLSLVPAGNYSCLVTDANGCLKTVDQLVTQPSSLEAIVESVRNIKCFGNTDGAVSVAVKGGTPPYTYTWSNGAKTEDLAEVAAGNYSVTVSDAIGNKKVLNATVTQPSAFQLKIEKVKSLSCFESNNGSVITSVSGGTPPYRFDWSNGNKTNDLMNAPGGDYTVTATDANGCERNEKVSIKEPSELLVKTVAVKNLKCANDKNGSVDIDVTGGVGPYSYSWSTGAKTQDLVNASAASYSVRVMDANGCVKTLAETVTEPDMLSVDIASLKHNNCAKDKNGSVQLNVTGGVAPYKYTWKHGATTQNIQNLSSGDYMVTVSDSNGCVAKAEAEIEEPTPLVVTKDLLKNVKCSGDNTGEINVSVSGGVQPYSYKWSNGATTQDLTQLPVGNYTLSVSDANACSNNDIAISLNEPEKLQVALDSVNNISCSGSRIGGVYISVKGGAKPYMFNWNNGSISEDLTRVSSGDYTVVIKDANGCTETISTKVSEPSLLSLSLTNTKNVKCAGDNDGAIDIAVNGGTAPYEYKWSNGANTQNISGIAGGEYSVLVKDALGCTQNLKVSIAQPPTLIKSIDAVTNLKCNNDNSGEIHLTVVDGVPPYTYQWSNGSSSQDLIGVPAGKYSVVITEGNGCQHTITSDITEPSVFTSEIVNVTNIKCHGQKTGAIDLKVNGGVAPYKIQWSNGAITEDITEVKAESYSVMVMDANGCMRSASAVVAQPAPLQLAIDSLYSVKCCGDSSGAIFISVTGGAGPYKYQWSNGAKTEDITGLKMGQYTVVVTDQNGCTVATPKEGMTLYDQIISQGKFVTRNILFDVGKSTIKPESFAEILKIATLMKDHPDLMFSIEGHTDADGDDNSNKILSQDRSEAIRTALIKMGIDDYRLEAKGWGETRPIDTNLTKEGKANNRRVEFILLLPPSSSR
ncbi:MAG: OmpA family protein [Cytophagaceae bacterium]|jgi:outer membrane protein OmpA-like peptidoglycan-associated protein|nr:OmpA family protein [Cytophagaceae bacterium]